MFRNVALSVLAVAVVASCAEPNTLPPDEAAVGFSLIFDGRTLAGWSAGKGNWDIDDGALHVRRKGGLIAFTRHKWPQELRSIRVKPL